MNKIPFSDDELMEAAKKVQDALLDALPSPSECEHQFSPEFEVRMQRLCAKERWKRSLRRVARRVAMIALTVCVGAGTWLAVDMDARAAFFGWVKERYENYIVYRFPDEAVIEASVASVNRRYRLGLIPEGYYLLSEGKTGNTYDYFYGNEEGNALSFAYAPGSSATSWFIVSDGTTKHQVMVNGYHADYLKSHDPDVASCVAWIDENNTAFMVDGFFTEEELIEIAESIEVVPEETAEPTEYRLGWMPEGLTERRHKHIGNSMQVAYADEQGRLLKFYCIYGEPSSAFSFYMEDPIYETVDVNGYAAEVMLSPSGEEGNTIYWTTEKNELFYISGFYPLEDLVKMAENVEPVTEDIE